MPNLDGIKIDPGIARIISTHRTKEHKHGPIYKTRVFLYMIFVSLAYGFLIPFYHSSFYGRILFQVMVPPILGILCVYIIAGFSLPDHKHTNQQLGLYALFFAIGIFVRIVAILQDDQKAEQKVGNVYDAICEGLWAGVVYYIYISKDPNYNKTYFKYVLPPLYAFSTIYSLLSGISEYAAMGGTVIWGIYSVIIGIFVFYDKPTAYFRRKFNHPKLGWIKTPIGFDGVYFSYYIFWALSLGPGAGMILAYTTHTDAKYYDAIMKSMAMQGFGIAAINILERVSLRSSSETRCNVMTLQFYLLIDTVQALIFLETRTFDWPFFKLVLIQVVGGLFLHSGMKDVILWVLGIAYNDQVPLISKSLKQLNLHFNLNLFIITASYVIALSLFLFESAAFDIAPSYNMTLYQSNISHPEEETKVWEFEEKGCAVTCIGYRTDVGVTIEDSESVVMDRSTGGATEVLVASFFMRFFFWLIEKYLCKRLHGKFEEWSTAVEEMKDSIVDERTTRDEITLKLEDMEDHEYQHWIRQQYAAILSTDAMRVGVEKNKDYIIDPEFGLEKLSKDKLWEDANALRKAFYTKCADGKEFGVEVKRRKVSNREEEEDNDDMDDHERIIGSLITDHDYSSIESIPTSFLLVSLWMAIHNAVMAFRMATDILMIT
eukprot:CAMPEP_0118659102 /NCGR_PEP_ID=MMETSP0785-20121206/14925_1 /TAXON_ID=91992 /ORGANISM="Bolidomonas pacifica, Strain CCMP 1866" /LENGTH=658 /DNA_ID=CAMNT_0006552169 /DNA_START=144 /DNA_END=2116 /DNA_ORIENTATION=-